MFGKTKQRLTDTHDVMRRIYASPQQKAVHTNVEIPAGAQLPYLIHEITIPTRMWQSETNFVELVPPAPYQLQTPVPPMYGLFVQQGRGDIFKFKVEVGTPQITQFKVDENAVDGKIFSPNRVFRSVGNFHIPSNKIHPAIPIKSRHVTLRIYALPANPENEAFKSVISSGQTKTVTRYSTYVKANFTILVTTKKDPTS